MKILVTYSSLSGNTKKLAEGIYNNIEATEKVILPIKQVESVDDFDVVLVGYWVDRGGPNKEAATFMESLSGKIVGVFATLGFWPDSKHAWDSIEKGEQIISENNTVLAKFICQGGISAAIIKQFSSLPADNPHAITPEKLKRYSIAEKHPSDIDILAAGELFRERLSIQDVQ